VGPFLSWSNDFINQKVYFSRLMQVYVGFLKHKIIGAPNPTCRQKQNPSRETVHLKMLLFLGYRAAEGLGHDARPEGDLSQRVMHHLPHHDVRVRLHVRLRRDLPLRLPQGSIEHF
jgi:hypothetical protein